VSRLTALILAVTLAGGARAVEPAPPPATGKPPESETAGKSEGRARTAETFRPSEDITGDAAVSFPADI
jgi:hypothetical protein